MPIPKSFRIGADVGGTFTDVILLNDRGDVRTFKIPSTPPNFEKAVLEAVRQLLETADTSGSAVSEVAHGTTVATNAVLERRGAHTALITTRGFRDVLELRRIRAPQMYDLFFDKPKPLVERAFRFELAERISAAGQVLDPIDPSELATLKNKLESEQVESVAVCLLHAYAFPHHETAVGDFLRKNLPKVQVSLSHEVLPERKEYERTATTVVNAYVQPVMQRYLEALRAGLKDLSINAPLLLMQSAGGLTPEREAIACPVYVLESGPAAGVLAARLTAQRMGVSNVIAFDMGGTTAKASLIENGEVSYSAEYEVGSSLSAGNRLVGGAGELIRAPSIDIAEVGAGGGSIAYLDRAGGLHVGPRSAGAVPGPVCYRRGGLEPTVTDANVVLGYIRPGRLANGEIEIDLEAAQRAIHDRIATRLNIETLKAAEGVHRIANARIMRALRAVSTQRGRDPREFALMAFGGSGPVHAVGLGLELNVRQIVVPPLPGLFSALGLLASGIEHHGVRSCLLSGEQLNSYTLEQISEELWRPMRAQFLAEGFPAQEVALAYSVDMRFQEQASEIRVALQGARFTDEAVRTLCQDFEREHLRLYGHGSDPENPIEIVAVRLVGRVPSAQEGLSYTPRALADKGPANRAAYFGKRWGTILTPVVERRAVGTSAEGPLLIDEYDSTIVVPPGMLARLDERGNVLIENRTC